MRGSGRRVVVTGFGVVAPCGVGREAFWTGLLGPNASGGTTNRITDWDPSPWYSSPKEARRADLFQQYATAAAAEAVEQAGEFVGDPARAGVIFGTGIGGITTLEDQIQTRIEKGERRVSPFLVPMMMANAAGAAISMKYGLRGPNETVCTACAASTHAIGYAARSIAFGIADVIVTGGSEAAATPTSIAGFGNMTALSSSGSSRPFDAERDGFVLGEGAGVLVLEEREHALARGATILAEILGAASNADAHHITAPEPGRHGCGGVHGAGVGRYADFDRRHRPDQRRTERRRRSMTQPRRKWSPLFGANGPPVVSTKGVTGHALGAAGRPRRWLSCSRSTAADLADGRQPTTLDPAATIDLVTGEPPPPPRAGHRGPTLSNNFGVFFPPGHNGSIIRYRPHLLSQATA
ncbi:MAG: beta-ketoacyl synthase N-terminal-like domain-containing protein [Ilumatobacteraceae bacterium]